MRAPTPRPTNTRDWHLPAGATAATVVPTRAPPSQLIAPRLVDPPQPPFQPPSTLQTPRDLPVGIKVCISLPTQSVTVHTRCA